MEAMNSDYYCQVLVIFTLITPILKMRIIERELSKSILLLFLGAVIWLFVNATVNRHNHSLSED
jgi:ABC-type polysaccharide/polyol phosphate export permease